MDHLFCSLVVVLCAAQVTLAQDCSTEAGQLEFLQKGAETDPNCYNPVIKLLMSDGDDLPTTAQIKVVCQDTCAGVMLNFLTSTEKCRNDQDVKDAAYFLQNELCAYKDGKDSPESSCALGDEGVDEAIMACLAWWDTDSDGNCPTELLEGVPPSTPQCAVALQNEVEEYGCCLHNLFGSEEKLNELAEEYIPPGSTPEDFDLEETVPDLFEACGVDLPDMCPSVVKATSGTGGTTAAPGATTAAGGATTAASAASGLGTTPLLALLLSLLAKLGTF